MNTMLWRRIHTEGAPPAPRVGHSATQLGLAMIVFGGFSKGKYFHDVHMLDVERLGWSQYIVTGTPPHGRVSHSATLIGDEILIFGGSAGGACYNDVIVLSSKEPEPKRRRKSAAPPQGSSAPAGDAQQRRASLASAVKSATATAAITYKAPTPPPSPPPSPPAGELVPYQPPKGGGDIVPYQPDQATAGGSVAHPSEGGRGLQLSQQQSQAARRRPDQQRRGHWKYPEVHGTPPAPRFSHTATPLGNLLFVVGGLARKGRAFAEVRPPPLRQPPHDLR